MGHAIGIEFISALGMPPVEFVHMAADLGCRQIGMALAPITPNPHRHAAWSLLEDAALRRAVSSALRERGVSISLGEGFMVRPGSDISDSAAALAAFCEIGTTRINMISIDSDRNRSLDQFATLVEMASAANVQATLEFGPILAVPDLPSALAAIRYVGRPGFRLLLDTMHLVRSGAGAADIAALDPALIGYVQLCDAPRAFTMQGYAHEAKCERLVPGEGELPLAQIIAALPPDMPLGLEVPQLSLAEAGVDTRSRLCHCIGATRQLLATVAGATQR
jgi:sugar phosphate isomerase/epimerase